MSYEVDTYEALRVPYIPLKDLGTDDVGKAYVVINGEADMIAVYADKGEFAGININRVNGEIGMCIDIHRHRPAPGDLLPLRVYDETKVLPADTDEFKDGLLSLVIRYYQEVVGRGEGTPVLNHEDARVRLAAYELLQLQRTNTE